MTIKELLINEQIVEKEVKLISTTGEQMGVMSFEDAMKLAEEQELDLVKMASNQGVAICKLMDYGKYRFEQIKKEKEQLKNQKIVELKEVRLSFNIQAHDIEIKRKNAEKFLKAGNKVKVSIRMFGRQQATPKFGLDVMANFANGLKDVAVIEKPAVVNGRYIAMVLAPIK
ncbi:MAG: translation initiation factor IF-3 [Christensenellales bacterium]